MTSLLNPQRLGAHLLGAKEVAAVTRVLDRGELFRHPDGEVRSENEAFETELAAWADVRGACTVASGTAGLRAALHAVGVAPGDEVLVSSYTFVATASAVASLGARPVPLELGPRLDVDRVSLEANLGRVRAVVPVYVPGHTSNVDEVTLLARAAGVPVVEDACQGLGVRVDGRPAGTIGHVGVYSFQQGKQLTCGEGGAVVTDDPRLLLAVRRFADHGAIRSADGSPTWPEDDPAIGENLRLGELPAAVLRVQLRRLDRMIERQQELRRQIRAVAVAAGVPVVDSRCPQADAGSWLALLAPSTEAAIVARQRAATIRLLVRPFWRQPFTAFPAFRGIAPFEEQTPRAASWAPRLIALPVPPLDASTGSQLVAAAASFFRSTADLWR